MACYINIQDALVNDFDEFIGENTIEIVHEFLEKNQPTIDKIKGNYSQLQFSNGVITTFSLLDGCIRKTCTCGKKQCMHISASGVFLRKNINKFSHIYNVNKPKTYEAIKSELCVHNERFYFRNDERYYFRFVEGFRKYVVELDIISLSDDLEDFFSLFSKLMIICSEFSISEYQRSDLGKFIEEFLNKYLDKSYEHFDIFYKCLVIHAKEAKQVLKVLEFYLLYLLNRISYKKIIREKNQLSLIIEEYNEMKSSGIENREITEILEVISRFNRLLADDSNEEQMWFICRYGSPLYRKWYIFYLYEKKQEKELLSLYHEFKKNIYTCFDVVTIYIKIFLENNLDNLVVELFNILLLDYRNSDDATKLYKEYADSLSDEVIDSLAFLAYITHNQKILESICQRNNKYKYYIEIPITESDLLITDQSNELFPMVMYGFICSSRSLVSFDSMYEKVKRHKNTIYRLSNKEAMLMDILANYEEIDRYYISRDLKKIVLSLLGGKDSL